MDKLSCKPSLKDVQKRLQSLYDRQAGDRSLPPRPCPARRSAASPRRTRTPSANIPIRPSGRPSGTTFSGSAAIDDDAMPAAYLSEFDQGLYGGLLGGEVRFMADPATGWISSMVPPLLTDWSEFDRLRFDPQHPWWQRYVRQLDVFVEAGRGRWGISHFILIDALNFVFELLGATRTYLSLDEHAEMVRRAIDFAYDLNVRVYQTFFETVPHSTAAPSAISPSGCPVGSSPRASIPST